MNNSHSHSLSHFHSALTTLAVGHVTHDRYGPRILPGGCAFYGGRVFAALGAHARLATAVGRNFACIRELKGLALAAIRSGQTVTFTNHYPRSGPRVQCVEGSVPPVTPDHIPSSWLDSQVVFLAPVLGEVDLDTWKRAVRPAVLGIGIQGFVKRAGSGLSASAGARTVVPRPWFPDPPELEGVDAAFLSPEDLEGQPGLLARLVRQVPVVVLTLGRDGCDVFYRRRVTRVGVYATDIVDPTGAGDTFAAAFLFALASGADPVGAARLGAAAASIVVEGRGGEYLHEVGSAVDRAALMHLHTHLEDDHRSAVG